MILLLTTALAAEVTAMPPALRGDVSIEYRGTWRHGTIHEAGKTYATERADRHDLLVTAEFAPLESVSVWLRFDATPYSALRFLDPHEMVLDPTTGSGTYAGGRPQDDIDLRASGLAGVWFGAAVAPFAERYERGQHATWRLDAAVRAPSHNTFWTLNGDHRGVAPGGAALALTGAFSVRRGVAEPYLVGGWTWEGRGLVEATDLDGDTAELTVDPADHVDVRSGVELVTGEDPTTGERFSVDLYALFAYQGWADIPSGVVLPGAIARTSGLVATRSDHVRAGAGLGALYAPIEQFGARFAVEGRWTMPHRIEHFTPATTGFDSVEITGSVTLEGRIR